jgi:hypothetical protein
MVSCKGLFYARVITLSYNDEAWDETAAITLYLGGFPA